jgi:hypothetical protein
MRTPALYVTMASLQSSSFFVAAHPVGNVVQVSRDEAPSVVLGEHASHRTIVVVFCISYAFLLALTQGEQLSSIVFSQRFSIWN